MSASYGNPLQVLANAVSALHGIADEMPLEEETSQRARADKVLAVRASLLTLIAELERVAAQDTSVGHEVRSAPQRFQAGAP